MAHSPRRITRKEIRRPDPFIVFSGRLLDIFRAHRVKFLSGFAVGGALLLAVWAGDSYRDRQNRLAAQEFSTALGLYHNGKYREALEALQKLDIYRASSYRRLGLLYQAHSYIALNDSAKADQALQDFLRSETKDPFLRQLAFLTLAHNQERTGRCKEAIDSYSKAEGLQAPMKEEALLGKARCSAQTQDFKEALNAYRQFSTSYPGSSRAKDAALLAQQMEVKAGEGGGK